MHRSVATHINRGEYDLISPEEYEAWSVNRNGEVSEIWLRRRP